MRKGPINLTSPRASQVLCPAFAPKLREGRTINLQSLTAAHSWIVSGKYKSAKYQDEDSSDYPVVLLLLVSFIALSFFHGHGFIVSLVLAQARRVSLGGEMGHHR